MPRSSELDEAQQKALAEQALTDFEASKGIASEEQQLFDRSDGSRLKTTNRVSDRRTRIKLVTRSECEEQRGEIGSNSAKQSEKN
jgi:hypothetical protein